MHNHKDLEQDVGLLAMGGRLTLETVGGMIKQLTNHSKLLDLARQFAEAITRSLDATSDNVQLLSLLLFSYHDRLLLAEKEIRLLTDINHVQDAAIVSLEQRLTCVEERTACNQKQPSIQGVHNGQKEVTHEESQ